MFIDTNTAREDLEAAIVCEPGLYETVDEQKLLNGEYTTDELREIVVAFIEAGDECAAA